MKWGPIACTVLKIKSIVFELMILILTIFILKMNGNSGCFIVQPFLLYQKLISGTDQNQIKYPKKTTSIYKFGLSVCLFVCLSVYLFEIVYIQ